MTAARIEIVIGDDNGTAAPLYKIYAQQYTPQPAYLEFDPDADGLRLTAGYSGEIGNALPARIWNGVEQWFTVPAAVRRSELLELADDTDLAALLERVKAGYDYDPVGPRGRYSDDAREAIEKIEGRLERLAIAEIWDADDWVDAGVNIADAAAHPTLQAYAVEFEGLEDANQVIDGDIAAAVARALARRVPDDAEDRSEQQAAVAHLLAAYDAEKYGYMIEEEA